LNPLQRYKQDLEKKLVVADSSQAVIVEELQQLYIRIESSGKKKPGLGKSFFGKWAKPVSTKNPAQGLYLWGGVGRGKTYLMDIFFDCLSSDRKERTHFHRFMQKIHNELARLQGKKNPLLDIAEGIASEAPVLCFDEFFVQDIGDAMILGGLMEALFDRGVVLVATSNIHPDGLYENGLQRERFLPAIELIKKHTKVVEIQQGMDYRLRSLSQANLYHCPISSATEAVLLEYFHKLAPDLSEIHSGEAIELLGREIQSRYFGDDVVWFDFKELCGGPRSAFDYVELAKLFHAVILSGVPRLDSERNAEARRFISLVDELYDRRVKLIISADVEVENLYQGNSLDFEFERTQSRLLEMQSIQYLSDQHRA
jgi:cell division protein ZapE